MVIREKPGQDHLIETEPTNTHPALLYRAMLTLLHA
jgi:hypothetical protein